MERKFIEDMTQGALAQLGGRKHPIPQEMVRGEVEATLGVYATQGASGVARRYLMNAEGMDALRGSLTAGMGEYEAELFDALEHSVTRRPDDFSDVSSAVYQMFCQWREGSER